MVKNFFHLRNASGITLQSAPKLCHLLPMWKEQVSLGNNPSIYDAKQKKTITSTEFANIVAERGLKRQLLAPVIRRELQRVYNSVCLRS